MPQQLYPRKEPWYPLKRRLHGHFGGRTIFCPARIQTPDSPAHSLINILTTLHPEEGDSTYISTQLHFTLKRQIVHM